MFKKLKALFHRKPKEQQKPTTSLQSQLRSSQSVHPVSRSTQTDTRRDDIYDPFNPLNPIGLHNTINAHSHDNSFSSHCGSSSNSYDSISSGSSCDSGSSSSSSDSGSSW